MFVPLARQGGLDLTDIMIGWLASVLAILLSCPADEVDRDVRRWHLGYTSMEAKT